MNSWPVAHQGCRCTSNVLFHNLTVLLIKLSTLLIFFFLEANGKLLFILDFITVIISLLSGINVSFGTSPFKK